MKKAKSVPPTTKDADKLVLYGLVHKPVQTQDKMCEYFAWGAAPTGNASNIQRRSKAIHTKNEDERGYDYDFERNNEVMNRLERVEANQEAMKLIMFTTIVLVGFTMLIVLLK
ncbi:unnamed protein product [Camellia sinensis]